TPDRRRPGLQMCMPPMPISSVEVIEKMLDFSSRPFDDPTTGGRFLDGKGCRSPGVIGRSTQGIRGREEAHTQGRSFRATTMPRAEVTGNEHSSLSKQLLIFNLKMGFLWIGGGPACGRIGGTAPAWPAGGGGSRPLSWRHSRRTYEVPPAPF